MKLTLVVSREDVDDLAYPLTGSGVRVVKRITAVSLILCEGRELEAGRALSLRARLQEVTATQRGAFMELSIERMVELVRGKQDYAIERLHLHREVH